MIEAMDDVVRLLDAYSAQRFLKRLPAAARRKGDSVFRSGCVQNLVAKDPGMAYSAQVLDGKHHKVDLHYDPEEGWEGACSCPQESDCEHVFATMSALLAEHR